MHFIKSMTALLLALCLPASSALADSRPPMRLMDIGGISGYWQEHPEISREAAWYNWRIDALTHIQGDDPPDVMMLRTNNDDFAAIRDAGALADLSGSAVIREAVGRMRREAREFVTAKDGQLLGLPLEHMVRPLYWFQDAWDAAGLSEKDVPQCYAELLDFLERWAESPVQGICVTRMIRWNGGQEACHYANWLLRTLTLDWVMQQQYAGEPVRFDTPEFITLARRAREIGLKLYEIEPCEEDRQEWPQLFQNDLFGGEHANDGREYGLSHTIPSRITRDQPMLMKADMSIACIRAGSGWQEEALGFLAFYKNEQFLFSQYALYTDFQPGAYEDEGGSFSVTKGWLADYQAYEGVLYYPQTGIMQRDRYSELLSAFFTGELTAVTLAREMDEIDQ